MSSGELLSYIELAGHFYTILTDYCNWESESDHYIKSDEVDTMFLKANCNSLGDVVFGLRQDGHNEKATKLEGDIKDLHKAVESHDNGALSGTQLLEKVLCITGELRPLCRPTASKTTNGDKAEKTGGNATLKSKIKDFLWTLYEKTLKVIVDAVMERIWPK